MSEYQEAHTVSSLKGSPPGYVGYGEGGVLTEAVRRKPYCVVLLDEVEKAHRDVLELFFQVFDKGMLEDGEGREIDFKNTVILLTSNVGTDEFMKLCGAGDAQAEGEQRPTPDQMRELSRLLLMKQFAPALLARMRIVPVLPAWPLDDAGDRAPQASPRRRPRGTGASRDVPVRRPRRGLDRRAVHRGRGGRAERGRDH